MRLVEQHTIKPSSVYYNELYDLLHKCKNLYNKGLYVVRQHYFQYKDDNTVNINGAFNIIRKSEKESFDVTMLPKGRGFWWNPVRISV